MIKVIEREKEKSEELGNRKKRNKGKKLKKVLVTLLILMFLGISTVLFLLYGPFPNFREWLITSAMTTMNHQYLATWFYSDETINEVMDKHKVIETEETTNPDLIIAQPQEEIIEYENEYERAVLEKDYEGQPYKIIDIKGKGYTGYLAVVYDASKVSVVTTKNLGTSGQYLVKMAEQNKALLAINGGGFVDENYSSTGGTPMGITISNGKIVTSSSYSGSGGIIGFTKENKLVLGKMTAKQAVNMGIRDAVSFGPFLIVNGEASFIKGNGGWGTAPRTAIGQRKDGIVLMLVIDGRTVSRPGADMKDLTEIMLNYGAYNAANLDGGTSSAMVVNNKLINDPIDSAGKHKTRPIATGFIVKE